MACPSAEEVQAYIDGTLAAEPRGAIERHCDDCRACRELLAGLVRTTISGPAEPTPGLAAGAQVGRFVIEGPLGAGAHGVVYAAQDPELSRSVAVKLLREDSPERRLRLLREAQALARVAHPNVCAVYELGTAEDGSVFIAMELVDGGSLTRWLREPARTQREILAAFAAAARGLAAAHAKGVVHRDFKPDNVLVGSDGRVRVTDFGLAGWMASGAPNEDDRGSPELTRSGTVMGTPLYMSPEQHAGRAADEKSDQFSLCVALWEALYRAYPFGGRDERELARSVLKGTPDAPPRGAGVPGRVARALRRGLSLRPEDRHPSMAELAAAIEPPRPRRVWAIALAVAAAGTAGALAVIGLRPAPARCRDPGARLAGVWDAPRRAEVAAAFQKSGHPSAEAVLAHVTARLDAYARAWTAMVAESCAATRVSGTQSEAVMVLREGCLDERLAGLRALGGVLASADVGVVSNASAAVDRLPRVEECARVAALTAVPPPPPEAAPRVAAARARLATARVFVAAVARDVGAAEVDRAVADADATGYAPLRAEARLVRAEMLGRVYDSAGAEAALYEAMSLAESGRDDRTRVRAAIAMVQVLWTAGRRAETKGWAALAAATIERLGGDDELAASLDEAVGLASVPAESIAPVQRALAARARLNGEDSIQVAMDLEILANAYWALGRVDEAKETMVRLRRITEARVGADPNKRFLELNGKVTQALGAGDFAGAVVYAEETTALVDSLVPPDDPVRIVSYGDLGQSYELASRPVEAAAARRRAIELAARTSYDPIRVAELWCDLARDELDAKRWVEAVAAAERGLELGPGEMARSDCWESLGEGRLGHGEARRAVEPLEEALAWRLAHAEEVPAGQIGRNQFMLARALWEDPATRARARELGQAARASYQRHLDRFAGQEGVAARYREVAAKRIKEVDAWLTASRP